MARAYIMDFEGTASQYDAVIEEMGLGGVVPDGAIFHYAGAGPRGWRVVDCWADADAFDRFAAETIGPITAKHGIGEPQIEVLEIAEERHGRLRPAAFLQVVHIPGMSREGFRAFDRLVLPDGRVPEAIVHHVNGTYDGGSFVIDTWTSREERDAFMQAHVIPNVPQAEHSGDPDIAELDVHNQIIERAQATA